ncbi:hypothetical protein ACFYXD_34970 [Streptomyces platensis]|uniref:hypothetical protein n=1 Tax=Streptomyces platensis TaxID=58346 RepID=UPI0036CBE50B
METNQTHAEPAVQGSHFWFATITVPNAQGYWMNGYQGTLTPPPGATRLDMFNAIRAEIDERDPRARGGLMTTFDIQPNQF